MGRHDETCVQDADVDDIVCCVDVLVDEVAQFSWDSQEVWWHGGRVKAECLKKVVVAEQKLQ